MDRLRFLLSVASSPNPTGLREAEVELREMEIQPRFHMALLSLVADQSIDVGVRLQAVLYLKNGIDRYWRKHATNGISEPEKAEIRSGLLQCYSEPSFPVALQIAVVVGKVARFDVPTDWPELIPALLEAIRCNETLSQHRALLLMYHSLKTLSTKRLAVDKKVFHDINEQLLPYLLQIWTIYHGQVVEAPPSATETDIVAPLEKSVLAMKILRKTVILGLRKPHENPEAIKFISTVLEQIKTLLTIRSTRFTGLRETLEKYIILHLKLMFDLLENHPFSFVPVMKDTLQTCCLITFSPDTESLLFQRCAIYCLNIVKQVLTCAEYKLPKQIDNAKSSPTIEADMIKREFFTPQITIEICKTIISKYLPLSRDELELWDTDPEQYVSEDGGNSWKYSLKPCAESAFLTVFHEYRETLAPVLVQMVHQSSGMVDANDLPAILHKEAIYNAVGLAAFDLYDEIDFDQWLVNGIAVELSVSDANYRLIRRRAVWLLGQWSGVKLSPEIRPKLYQLLLPLLEVSEDLVVRLSAAKALKVVIDDFEFTSEEMKPYLNSAFSKLFALLKEVNECDTKLSILNVLSYLIERVGIEIRSICSEMVHYLPSLWDASVDHNMLRCSIVSTLVYIVTGLGTISESLAPFLYDVISLSVDVNNSCSVYLLEDGLELWLTVLHNSKNLLPQLIELTSKMPPILELGSENLRTMILIIQSYTLLAPEEFLIKCGDMVCNGLQAQYSDLQDEGVLFILRLMDLIVKIGPPQCVKIFKNLILCSFRAIHDGDDYPTLMSFHLSIASRVLLAYQSDFNDFINHLSVELQSTPDQVAGRILDVWLDKMNCVTQNDQKKLLALALASLLTSGSPVIIDRIYAVFLNVTETLHDVITHDVETQTMADNLQKGFKELINPEDVDYETEHDVRKRQWSAKDIVYKVNLRDYFQSQMADMAAQLGQHRYAEIMQNVDLETLNSMKEYIQV